MTEEKNLYSAGIALIMEGDTEKYFYEEVLKRICKDNNITIEEKFNDEEGSTFYEIVKDNKILLLKIKNAETITQITNQFLWFKNFCHDKCNNINWSVVLCYDTDGNDFSIFKEADWKSLKEDIVSMQNVDLIDCYAHTDIEDLFLIDIDGIKNFLGISNNITIKLRGRKGKVKLKNLYTDYTDKTYHEGRRALPLIQSLNLRKIINHPDNNVKKIEHLIISKVAN